MNKSGTYIPCTPYIPMSLPISCWAAYHVFEIGAGAF